MQIRVYFRYFWDSFSTFFCAVFLAIFAGYQLSCCLLTGCVASYFLKEKWALSGPISFNYTKTLLTRHTKTQPKLSQNPPEARLCLPIGMGDYVIIT